MEILHYQVDLKSLLDVQQRETELKNKEKEIRLKEGRENKKALLKYVLPFMHGVFALHNNKCDNFSGSSTGKDGLLGINKVDIEKDLDFIVNTDLHSIWSENYTVFTYNLGRGMSIKMWLNSGEKHVATPDLPYSMTSPFTDKVYATSLEDELVAAAKFCSRYTQEW